MANSEFYPISIPKKLKFQTNIPFWNFKILFKTLFHLFFYRKHDLESRIYKTVSNIHNIDFENYKFLNSGRTSLIYIFKYFHFEEGDTVLLPSFTCRSVLHSILQYKLKPLFVDIDDQYNINIENILAYKYIKNVKAIIIPNMFGIINKNHNKLKILKDKYNIYLIEDNATSFGVHYNKKPFSDAIFYSFNIGKMINGAGGGLVLFRSNKYKNEQYELKNNVKYSIYLFFKFLIILRFRKIFNFISILRKNKSQKLINVTYTNLDKNNLSKESPVFFNLYDISKINLCLIYNQLNEFGELKTHNEKIKKKYLEYFDNLIINRSNYISNLVVLDTSNFDRNELGQFFSKNGIESYWSYFPLHKIDIYKKINALDNLNNTERLWKSFLYLPINFSISENDVSKIYEIFHRFQFKKKENQFIFDNFHTDKNLTHDIKNLYDRKYINRKIEFLNRYTNDNDNVLDLCCGSGEFYDYIKNKQINYFGIDFSKNLLEKFKKKNVLKKNSLLINCDAENLKIKDNSINLCFCYSSIYYIKNIEKVFAEITRVLNKNGLAIIEFATKSNINSFISEYWYRNGTWGKPYFINYDSMINIIKMNNMNIVHESHFQILPVLRGPLKYIFFANSLFKHFIHFTVSHKTIDEHISSSNFLKKYSFKHIYVLKKNDMKS